MESEIKLYAFRSDNVWISTHFDSHLDPSDARRATRLYNRDILVKRWWYYWTTARSWVFPWHSRNHVVTQTIAATCDLEVTFQLYITGLTGNTDTNIIQYLCGCSTFPDLSMPNCLTQHVSKWVKTIDLQRICLPFFGHDPHVYWAYARCPLYPTLLKCQLSMKFLLGLSYPLQFLIAINNKNIEPFILSG